MDDSYARKFLEDASKLDAISNQAGELTKYASAITNEQDRAATIAFCTCLSELWSQADGEIKRRIRTVRQSMLLFYGRIRLRELLEPEQPWTEKEKTLPELLAELNDLVGLKKVKTQVHDLIAYQKVKKLRKEKGLVSENSTLHLAFMGNPGTGKTTVARIVGRMYKQLGLLSKGHFLEVSRTDLIAGYQGQTALKVKSVIEKAKGGVLFIDEAYSITENDHTDSYGRECLTELTKALEDYRDDLVVIVAGYTKPMQTFFTSNPGLKSRFNTFIEFDDYDAEELQQILLHMCSRNSYRLTEDAASKVADLLAHKVATKGEQFANGRMVRNIYEDLVMAHARRVAQIEAPSIAELQEIRLMDVDTLGEL